MLEYVEFCLGIAIGLLIYYAVSIYIKKKNEKILQMIRDEVKLEVERECNQSQDKTVGF